MVRASRIVRGGVCAAATAVAIVTVPPLVGTGSAASLVDQVAVDAHNPAGASTVSLTAGTTYTLTASGTFKYIASGLGPVNATNQSESVSDAECTNLLPDTTFQRDRFGWDDQGQDPPDLYVNGQNVDWTATTPDSLGCNSTDHTYTYTFTPTSSGPVNLAVHTISPDWRNGTWGALNVTVALARVFVEGFDVPVNTAAGATSTTSLDPSKHYLIRASGTYTPNGGGGLQSDAACTSIAGSPGNPHYSSALQPGAPGDPLQLYINGQTAAWSPEANGTPAGCDDSGHTYVTDFQPSVAGPVNFAVSDSYYGDNFGLLHVEIYEEPAPAPAAGTVPALPKLDSSESVVVDTHSTSGTNSNAPVVSGQDYLLEVTGTYGWGGGLADAFCSTTTTDPTWIAHRFDSSTPGALTLLVNGAVVPWSGVARDANNCDTTSHTYRYDFVPTSNGLVNFRVLDTYAGDNSGALTVKIYRVRETQVGVDFVDSSSPSGTSSTPLTGGNTYRLHVTGTFSFWKEQSGYNADAECTVIPTDPTQQAFRYSNVVPGQDYFDLYVGGQQLRWVPSTVSTGDCDPTHTYDALFKVRDNGQLNMGIFANPDSYPHDSGQLRVDIYQELN